MNATQNTYTDALRNGDVEAVKNILLANPSWVNLNLMGFTPLVLASYHNHIGIVKTLLDMGAEVDAKDGSGNTALMGATFKGFEETVKLLLEAGAEVNSINHQGATALTFACTFNQERIAQMLISHGADPDIKDERGNTPLDHARMQGFEWAESLLVNT